MREGCIGLQEALFAAALSMTAKLLFLEQTVLQRGGNGLWQSCLLSGLLTAGLLLLTFWFINRTGAPGLFEAFDKALGPVGSGGAKLLFSAVQWGGATLLLLDVFSMLKRFVMENSPTWFIAALVLLGAIPMAWMGLETLGRVSKLLCLVFFATLAYMVVATVWSWRADRLFPLLGPGVEGLAAGSVVRMGFWSDALLLTTLPRALQSPVTMKKAAFWSVGVAFLASLLPLLALSFTISYPELSQLVSPLYKLSGFARITRNTGANGAFLVFLWIGAASASLGLMLYNAGRSWCGAFGIHRVRAVLPALFGLTFFAVLLIDRGWAPAEALEGLARKWSYVPLAAPVLVGAAVSLFQRKRAEKPVGG